MLKIIHDDLFNCAKPAAIIAHGANAQGAMGKGFAKQLRHRYPLNYLEYHHLCERKMLKLGQWLLVHEKGMCIYNLITQEVYGDDMDEVYVDYDAVRKGLKVVQKYGSTYDLPIHMPFIGGGLAHGDKDRLMAIFEEVFATTDAMLYIPHPRKALHGHQQY